MIQEEYEDKKFIKMLTVLTNCNLFSSRISTKVKRFATNYVYDT